MILAPASNIRVPHLLPQFRRGRASAGGGGPSFIINEDFEGTGTPSGWFRGGAADFDYTASPLAGSQSLRNATGSDYAVYLSGGVLNEAEVWGKLLFKPEALPSTFSQIFAVNDGSFNTVFQMVMNSSGTMTVADNGAGVFQATSDAMSAGTLYRLYWHYKKGTGSNGIAEGGFATTDVRPTSGNKYAGGATAVPTANAEEVAPMTAGNGAIWVFDNVQVSTTAFD
jgi:hypothetical protein